jgi:hypothetical protein
LRVEARRPREQHQAGEAQRARRVQSPLWRVHIPHFVLVAPGSHFV